MFTLIYLRCNLRFEAKATRIHQFLFTSEDKNQQNESMRLPCLQRLAWLVHKTDDTIDLFVLFVS